MVFGGKTRIKEMTNEDSVTVSGTQKGLASVHFLPDANIFTRGKIFKA